MFLALILSAVEAKSPDEKDGWKEAKWDSAPLADMTCTASGSPDERECTRPSGDLVIGESSATKVRYTYWRDKLVSVTVILDMEARTAVLDGLKSTYGEGFQSNRYIKRFLWQGDKVGILYDEASDGATVFYLNKPLSDVQKKAAASKAASDL